VACTHGKILFWKTTITFAKKIGCNMTSSPQINAYWLLLKDLSAEEKLSLIELLVKSLQPQKLAPKTKKISNKTVAEGWAHRFEGSWSDFPESAEELIELIEGARTMGREIEML
jgi:hypothetical protein